MEGLIDILEQSGCNLVGIGVVIEKGFSRRRQKFRERGIRLESLAIIDESKDGKIIFI